MKHSLTGPAAVLGLVILAIAAFLVSTGDLPPAWRNVIQVSSGLGSSGATQIGTSRSGRLVERVDGARTAEDRRRLWSSGGQTLSLAYQVAVSRGRLRLAVEEVGLQGRTLWSTGVEDSRREQIRVPVTKAGNYEVVVRMSGFGGHYEVEYGIQ
jgi:hypothetical protein